MSEPQTRPITMNHSDWFWRPPALSYCLRTLPIYQSNVHCLGASWIVASFAAVSFVSVLTASWDHDLASIGCLASPNTHQSFRHPLRPQQLIAIVFEILRPPTITMKFSMRFYRNRTEWVRRNVSHNIAHTNRYISWPIVVEQDFPLINRSCYVNNFAGTIFERLFAMRKWLLHLFQQNTAQSLQVLLFQQSQ